MKTLFAFLTRAMLIAAPAFVQSASAAPAQPTYHGYPVDEWHTVDSW
jgi:hypothetical protein